MSQMRLLTNHGRALLCIAKDCDVRLRDLAECIGITERAAHRVVCDLVGAGYINRSKNGRRNCYELLDSGAAELEDLADLARLASSSSG